MRTWSEAAVTAALGIAARPGDEDVMFTGVSTDTRQLKGGELFAWDEASGVRLYVNGREAARRMVTRGRGTILFTGATASLRGAAVTFAQLSFYLSLGRMEFATTTTIAYSTALFTTAFDRDAPAVVRVEPGVGLAGIDEVREQARGGSFDADAVGDRVHRPAAQKRHFGERFVAVDLDERRESHVVGAVPAVEGEDLDAGFFELGRHLCDVVDLVRQLVGVVGPEHVGQPPHPFRKPTVTPAVRVGDDSNSGHSGLMAVDA